MVFHLPNEASLRTTKSYTDMFMLTLVWNVSLLGMLVTVLFIVFYVLKKYQLRIAQNQSLRDSIITENESAQQITPEDGLLGTAKTVRYPNSIFFRIVNALTSFFFYFFWVILGLFYLAFYSFGSFGRGVYVDALSVLGMTLLVVLPTIVWKYYTRSSPQIGRKSLIATIVLLLIWLGLCIFLVIALKGACVCYFTDKYGLIVDAKEDVRLSTDFTRTLELQPVCPSQQVCHLYATVPGDPSSSVFFNAHTALDLDYVRFLLFNDTFTTQQISQLPYRMDNVETIGQRNVHSVLFTGLAADTLYRLQVQDRRGVLLNTTKYKTVPGPGAQRIKMIAGGDLGMTSQGELMTGYISSFQPDIILIGGDTVYDDGMRTCYYSWDIFYRMFQPVYEKLGRLVPLVMSVGNHDVGFDALDPVYISQTNDYLPLFFAYNPQHLSQNGTGVPPVLERQPQHYHLIGPMVHLHLDSGYIKSFESQIPFIRETVTQFPRHYPFANYHNPIYPICADQNEGSKDDLVIKQGTLHWLPLFDQFRFTAVFEHHGHYRKITHRIKNGAIDQTGTRYVGDGSWGVPNGTCSQTRQPSYMNLIEDYAQEAPNHYWQVTLTKTNDPLTPYAVNYTAVDMAHKKVSEVVDPLKPHT